MAGEQCTLGRIHWSETFPFVRLFSTFRRAISFWPLLLAFSCVMLCYISGRVLDRVWKAADAGVRVVPGERFENEIFAYAAFGTEGFEDWLLRAERRLESVQAAGEEAASEEHAEQRTQVLTLIGERLNTGLERIDANEELEADQKEEQRQDLRQAADVLRFWLAGCDPGLIAPQREQGRAIETILSADPDISRQQRAEEQGRLTTAVARQRHYTELEEMRPSGPFITLLDYEMRCFAAAIQGACNGRWGLSGSALSSEPAMIGSVASAGTGVSWLMTQRPCFAVFLGLIMLVIFAFFGGAICRVAAMQSAREESTSFSEALRFSREKFTALFAAPLLPMGIFIFAGALIFVSGVVSAIPFVGEIVAGPLYVLSLIGGAVMAFFFLAVVLGFHLMWPTIAVEGSDAFDALQRAAGYVLQRAWHVAFYSFALLLYGAGAFVIVRIMAMLLFKLTHVASGAGMNLASSANTETVGKLDAIWHMPAWQDLPLLPAMGDVNFWGDFRTAPLAGSESFAMVFIAIWVFGLVGLVGAFVVSFYFCGSTEMYFLLRREVDAIDYDEVYHEEPEDAWDDGDDDAGAPVEPEHAEPEDVTPDVSTPAEQPEPAEVEEPEPSAEKPEKPKKPRKPRKPRKPSEPKVTDDAPEEGADDPPATE